MTLLLESTIPVNPDVITLTNFNPVGNWSTIFVARPALSPSLYIEILYVTTLPVFTTTGSFLCLYVAVVPLSKLDVSIEGILVFLTSTPSTFVIYFLKAKSNSFSSFGIFVISTIGCVFWSAKLTYNVTFAVDVAVPFLYCVAFCLAVFIK